MSNPVPIRHAPCLSTLLSACAIAASVEALVGCGSGGSKDDDPAPATWQRAAQNPLLIPPKSLAPATTFEVSIADPSVLYDSSDGLWKAWYSATIFDTAIASDPGRIVVKYAESTDGVHWTVQATPVISARVAPGDWDYTHVETPSVIRNPDPAAPANKRFMLFYAGGNTVTDGTGGRPLRSGYPYYAIGLAWSADGRAFTRDVPGVDNKPGLLLKASAMLANVTGYFDGLIADPEATVVDGTIRLWCSSYAEDSARSPLAFGISHARSTDGHAWTFPAANPLASLYKSGELAGGEQPAVLYDAGLHRFEMWFKNDTAAERLLIPTDWFTAYGFWRATSSDGVTWTPDYSIRDFAWNGSRDYETYGLLTGCSVVRHDGVDHLFYCAWGTHGIPDPTLYQVPLRSGSTVPAVITFAKATREAPMNPPHAVAGRSRHRTSVLPSMLGAIGPSPR
ncbi:MAG TPA: hypothetical protein VHX44_04270 [Planctomycetota bacterium]|nr:hypothetical protein [Planctomycetota bacterium]